MDFKKRFEGKTSQIGREGHIANIAAPAQPINKEIRTKGFSNLSTQNNTASAAAGGVITFKGDISDLLTDPQPPNPAKPRRQTGVSVDSSAHKTYSLPTATEESTPLYRANPFPGFTDIAPGEDPQWRSSPAQQNFNMNSASGKTTPY